MLACLKFLVSTTAVIPEMLSLIEAEYILGGSASSLQNRSNLRVVTGYKSAEISEVFSHRSLLLHKSWGS